MRSRSAFRSCSLRPMRSNRQSLLPVSPPPRRLSASIPLHFLKRSPPRHIAAPASRNCAPPLHGFWPSSACSMHCKGGAAAMSILLILACLMGASGVALAAAAAHGAPGAGLDAAAYLLLFHAVAVLGAAALADQELLWQPIALVAM